MTNKILSQNEIATKVKTLCNGLSGKNLVELMSELYWGLTDSEKDKFLELTENS